MAPATWQLVDLAGRPFEVSLANVQLQMIAGRRETTFDHCVFAPCWCDGSNCPPSWREYERVPALDEFRVNGRAVSREVWEPLVGELARIHTARQQAKEARF